MKWSKYFWGLENRLQLISKALAQNPVINYICKLLKNQVHWDDPEGWNGEGGGRSVQDGEHMYTCGGFI